jgi:hypothetical protein
MDINAALKQELEAYQSISKAKAYLQDLEKRIWEEREALQQLQLEVDRELQDYEAAEKLRLQDLFQKQAAREAAREKELEEYYLAVKKFKAHQQAIDLLEFEKKVLRDKLRKETQIRKNLEKWIARHKREILQAFPDLGIQFQDTTITAEEVKRIKRETQEAQTLAYKISRQLEQIKKHIQHVHDKETWGNFENAVPSRPVSKRSPLARAFTLVEEVKPWFRDMKAALEEINQSQVYSSWSGPGYFNCFTVIERDRKHSDFIPKSRLKDAMGCLDRHLSWLLELGDNLNRQLIKISEQKTQSKERQLDLIMQKLLDGKDD